MSKLFGIITNDPDVAALIKKARRLRDKRNREIKTLGTLAQKIDYDAQYKMKLKELEAELDEVFK